MVYTYLVRFDGARLRHSDRGGARLGLQEGGQRRREGSDCVGTYKAADASGLAADGVQPLGGDAIANHHHHTPAHQSGHVAHAPPCRACSSSTCVKLVL
eukprot:7389861-Pyramimonas_sp.AAC.1